MSLLHLIVLATLSLFLRLYSFTLRPFTFLVYIIVLVPPHSSLRLIARQRSSFRLAFTPIPIIINVLSLLHPVPSPLCAASVARIITYAAFVARIIKSANQQASIFLQQKRKVYILLAPYRHVLTPSRWRVGGTGAHRRLNLCMRRGDDDTPVRATGRCSAVSGLLRVLRSAARLLRACGAFAILRYHPLISFGTTISNINALTRMHRHLSIAAHSPKIRRPDIVFVADLINDINLITVTRSA
ncbi:hypothetical protein C8R44DRAFT_896474 [Mycena epipterygia]|nr:hypothetical protein C8R44DRAFT_896474 [Mycena epipterygia]